MTVGELLSYHKYDDCHRIFNQVVIVDENNKVLERLENEQDISEYQHLYVNTFYGLYYGIVIVVNL